jgi:hypothetical protein
MKKSEVSKNRYRLMDGNRWIEVRIKSALQLFDSRDPAPFRDRDLDDDFVEYIQSAAKEFPKKTQVRIIIYIEEKRNPELNEGSISEAIQGFFIYQCELQKVVLSEYLKRSRLFLLIGVTVLALSIFSAQLLKQLEWDGPLSILREGLIIFGWVALWKPLELILYDWYPHYEKLQFYKRLIETEVRVQFKE